MRAPNHTPRGEDRADDADGSSTARSTARPARARSSRDDRARPEPHGPGASRARHHPDRQHESPDRARPRPQRRPRSPESRSQPRRVLAIKKRPARPSADVLLENIPPAATRTAKLSTSREMHPRRRRRVPEPFAARRYQPLPSRTRPRPGPTSATARRTEGDFRSRVRRRGARRCTRCSATRQTPTETSRPNACATTWTPTRVSAS